MYQFICLSTCGRIKHPILYQASLEEDVLGLSYTCVFGFWMNLYTVRIYSYTMYIHLYDIYIHSYAIYTTWYTINIHLDIICIHFTFNQYENLFNYSFMQLFVSSKSMELLIRSKKYQSIKASTISKFQNEFSIVPVLPTHLYQRIVAIFMVRLCHIPNIMGHLFQPSLRNMKGNVCVYVCVCVCVCVCMCVLLLLLNTITSW